MATSTMPSHTSSVQSSHSVSDFVFLPSAEDSRPPPPLEATLAQVDNDLWLFNSNPSTFKEVPKESLQLSHFFDDAARVLLKGEPPKERALFGNMTLSVPEEFSQPHNLMTAILGENSGKEKGYG